MSRMCALDTRKCLYNALEIPWGRALAHTRLQSVHVYIHARVFMFWESLFCVCKYGSYSVNYMTCCMYTYMFITATCTRNIIIVCYHNCVIFPLPLFFSLSLLRCLQTNMLYIHITHVYILSTRIILIYIVDKVWSQKMK